MWVLGMSKYASPMNHVPSLNVESLNKDICTKTINTKDTWKQRLNAQSKILIPYTVSWKRFIAAAWARENVKGLHNNWQDLSM